MKRGVRYKTGEKPSVGDSVRLGFNLLTVSDVTGRTIWFPSGKAACAKHCVLVSRKKGVAYG
jgi:hypothetical protein